MNSKPQNCLVCGTGLDPQDPNSIAVVVSPAPVAGTRYVHIAHVPPLGEASGAEGPVNVLGSPFGELATPPSP